MSKLPQAHRFWDISDYARPGARWLVRVLHPTPIGSITLTWLFTLVGLISITLIYHRKALVFAGILLILKSLIDAADGEMARARNRPSYTGRYLDSINDFILNGLILFAVGIPLMIPIWKILLTWCSFQLQGTIFNYFYVIKRHQANGDMTSRILEFTPPVPYPYENPKIVSLLHKIYLLCYGWQDGVIDRLLGKFKATLIPNWLMSMISLFGLGFQLLIIALLLWINRLAWVFPVFLIVYNSFGVMIIVCVAIWGLKENDSI